MIRGAREARGLTREDLLVQVRILSPPEWTAKFSTNTILNWESGATKKVDALALPLIAVALDLPPGYFFEKILERFTEESAAPPAADDAGRARRGDPGGAVADAAELASRRPRGRSGQSPRRSKGSPG